MLPHLNVRHAQESDALDALVQAIGSGCLCNLSRPFVIVTDQALVAIQGDRLVGFVAWQQDEMQAAIVGLGVDVPYRRFGVATLLVDTLVDVLRDTGLRLLETTVPCAGVAPIFIAARFRQIGQCNNGDLVFERRLWGRRNKADGFS